MKPGRFTTNSSDLTDRLHCRFLGLQQAAPRPLGCSVRQMPPSRQERRKAERDAAKRAPTKAGAGGAGGAAAAPANLNVNHPLGDWTTQAADPFVGPFG